MAQRTASSAPDDGYRRTATLIATWYAEHGDVLRGALALRDLSERGVEASIAVLSVPVVRRFAVSVALFDAMTRSSGHDPTELLSEVLEDEPVGVVTAIGDLVVVGARRLELVSCDEVRHG